MVIADTDILIAAIRGNKIAQSLISKYMPNVYISAVTEIELYIGATNTEKKNAVKQILKTHTVLHLSRSIGNICLRLIKTYNTSNRNLYMPDALIAATCIEHGYSLLTFNTKDYKFIKGLKLAK